jgi:hypothetical protein
MRQRTNARSCWFLIASTRRIGYPTSRKKIEAFKPEIVRLSDVWSEEMYRLHEALRRVQTEQGRTVGRCRGDA